jgi:2-keto-3-deoxy-L-fuconate dehydrogenase
MSTMHRTIKVFLPAMLAGGGGSIVNISCAALRPPANRYVYSASKAAVSLPTRGTHFITQAIRCNSIAPAPWRRFDARGGGCSPMDARNSSPARRWAGSAPPRDRSHGGLSGGDESAFTTGVDLVVDGGHL